MKDILNKLTNNSPRRVILDTREKFINNPTCRTVTERVTAVEGDPQNCCQFWGTACRTRSVLLAVAVLGIASSLAIPSAHAEKSVEFSVSLDSTPIIEITLPTSPIVLDVTPTNSSAAFNSIDMSITVATSNVTGYTLTMYATNTNLTHTATSSYTIPTLGSGSFACTPSTVNDSSCTFTANTWGYRKSTDTANTYKAIPSSSSPTELGSNSTSTNGDTINLAFASKINNTKPTGTYQTTLNFVATAHPVVYMQNFTESECSTLASSGNYLLVDERDSNTYTVRYINGRCWMTQNLNLAAGTTLTSALSNVATNYTIPTDSLISGDSSTANSFTAGRTYDSGTTAKGWYYNYCAASAGTTCQTGSATATETVYDICPKGWRLPTQTEFEMVLDYATQFAPVHAAHLYNGATINDGHTYYWTSTIQNTASRYILDYNNSGNLSVTSAHRTYGLNIRCVKDHTYIQDFTTTMCSALASNTGYTVYDKRDEQSYTVRYINGNCWMAQSLNLAPGTTVESTDSNVTTSYTLPTSTCASGVSNTGCVKQTDGIYRYNTCAASAGTVCSAYSGATTISYDICPANWSLPTETQANSLQGSTYVAAFSPSLDGMVVAYLGAWQNPRSEYRSALWYTSSDNQLHVSSGLNYVSNPSDYMWIRCVRK